MLVLTGILFLLLFINVYQRLQPAQYSVWELDYLASLPEYQEEHSPKRTQSFSPFDPNTADSSQLLSAGFSPKQTAAFLKYRNAGATFKRKEDLLKLYWMNEELYVHLNVQVAHSKSDLSEQKTETLGEAKKRAVQYINLNAADSQALVQIKGIGSYTASKLIRYRSWLGGFYDTAQIREIKGLRLEQQDLLIQLQKGSLSPFERIHINTAELSHLQAHPYIRYKAKVIIAYRTQHGPFQNAQDLLKTGVLKDEDLAKLLPYLDFTP